MSSSALLVREAIKADLVAQGILAADRIVVERQTDVLSNVAAIVAKLGAVALTISPARGTKTNVDSKAPIWTLTMTLTLWTRAVMSLGETPEEEIHEAILMRLHHLELPDIHGKPGFQRQRLEVTEWQDVADPQFLRRDTTVRTAVILQAP